MVISSEFVKSARSFVEEQSQVFASQYINVRVKYEDNEYVQTIGRLRSVLDLTTESIFVLAESEVVRDSQILFRLKSEIASLEQSIRQMAELTKGEDSVDAETTEISKDIMQYWKTGEGDGHLVKEVVKKWNFWNVSRVLKKECRHWAISADTWELRYATANVLIHKSSVGNKHVVEKYRSIRDGENSPLFSAATTVEGCVVLQFDRLYLFSKRLSLDSAAIADVKSRHEDFFAMLAEIRAESDEAAKRQLEDYV